jgi:hypothetical protein
VEFLLPVFGVVKGLVVAMVGAVPDVALVEVHRGVETVLGRGLWWVAVKDGNSFN